MSRAAVIALLVTAAGVAHAEPTPMPDLRVRREPPPRNLRMRPRVAQTAPAQPTRATPMPAAPSVRATSPEAIPELDGLRSFDQPVSFSLNLGYQLDSARQTGEPTLGGRSLRDNVDYETLRTYGFGEGFFSSRGLVAQSLSSYFAFRFQTARKLEVRTTAIDPIDPVPPPGRDTLAPPIATWFERSGVEVRSGWAEVRDFLPKRWGLRGLRVRAGDQFIYGPWIVHLAGIHAAFESPTVTASAFTGVRRSDYTRAQSDNEPVTYGGALRFDLRGLTRDVPIAVTGEFLGLDRTDAQAARTGQPGVTRTAQLQFDWRPKRDVVVIGLARGLRIGDDKWDLASQRLEIRTRFREVTNVVIDVHRRFDTDWRWDPTLVTRRTDDPTEARRYLDLGPVRPQLLIAGRGGTLIAENIDLFARVALSTDESVEDSPIHTYSASYVELGGALEVRLRRQVAFGASVLRRSSEREEVARINDEVDRPDALPSTGALGEDSFLEAGTTVRLTLGARRFSTLVELYGRQTDYVQLYRDRVMPVRTEDARGGGRFTIDAWIGRRMRMFASYDVSTAFDAWPEITGYKSLRLVLTGVY